jgi:hypothetical protein
MKKTNEEYTITDYNYFGSTVGNAFHSGITFEELWQCVSMSETREELDFAVTATIDLNEITKKDNLNERR